MSCYRFFGNTGKEIGIFSNRIKSETVEVYADSEKYNTMDLRPLHSVLLPKLSVLRVLIIDDVRINNIFLKDISFESNPLLQKLEITRGHLCNLGFNYLCKAIKSLKNLEVLNLGFNKIKDLRKLKGSFKVLILDYNKLNVNNEVNLHVLGKLVSQLTYLDISNNNFNGANLEGFALGLQNANDLKVLNITGNNFRWIKEFREVFEDCLPKLQDLFVSSMSYQPCFYDAIRFKPNLKRFEDDYQHEDILTFCLPNNVTCYNRSSMYNDNKLVVYRTFFIYSCKLIHLGLFNIVLKLWF